MGRARYSRWDATQDPLGDDLSVRDVLDELSEELLSGMSPRAALRELQRRGMPGRFEGLDALRDRLRELRLRAAQDLNLSGPLEKLRDELNEVLELERLELSATEGDEARLKEAMLDALPTDAGGRLRELMNYEFASQEAARRFQELVDRLKQEILNSYFQNLAGSMRDVKPEDLARVKDMLAELNDMIAARERGDDYDFDGFMSRYGDMFPENPRNLDELLQSLAQRIAAMSRLLAGLTPEQRAELLDLARSVLDDLDLAFQVDRLSHALRELMPELPWDEPTFGLSDEPMPASAAVDAVQRMTEYEDLEQALSGDYAGADLADIDEEELRRALGEEAVKDLERLKQIERMLEQSGVVTRDGGRLELTARGARIIGERSLTRLLARIRREPSHRAKGGQAEPTGQTRPWTFGDADPISVERTVYNAVVRSGAGRRVSLSAQDFEVIETESRPQTATALLLDLSFSMPLRGHWVPAKRMALALHALIEGKYPQDKLFLVGFSDYAREMTPADLAAAGWEHVHGTNMQHAFMLARRLLNEDPSPVRQVIMVTDGEPTAHLDEDGYALFNWPPIRETTRKTLQEAARLARCGVSINVFMLEESPGLIAFMDRLAKITGGQVVAAQSPELSDTIIGDYVRRRSRRMR